MDSSGLTVGLRFYGELNFFLRHWQRKSVVHFPLNDRTAVKHPIESFGVPHTEVDLILANGAPVDFSYLLQPGDRIAVYPPFRTLNLDGVAPLRPPLQRPIRFLLDVHLGRLARYLRLLGFDAAYETDCDDAKLARLAHETERVLVSRDRRLLMRKEVVHGVCLRARDPEAQLRAILRRFNLFDAIQPWRRCLACNGELRTIAKEEILHRLEPKTRRYYNEFHICTRCDKIYWKGSHYEALHDFIQRIQRW